MSPKPARRPSDSAPVIKIERVTRNGRILYSVRSILESATVKRHLAAMQELDKRGAFREAVPAKD